jgi:hypothetical protein
LNNIEPININSKEETAKFEIKFDEKEKDILKKYSYIQIILIDRASICSDFHCLCEDNDKFEIEKRNISNEKAIDSNKNISEIKKTELIKKGEKFNINETSNYKLIDSVQKLSKFYLLTLNQKDQYWDKFKFILNLNEDKFNEEDFIEKYNEVCGHEVNLFLYFKYPKIFNKYIKDILKFKFEKTFIDYFLLDDYETLVQYLTPLKIKLLSTDELCLLMLKIINKKPEEAAKIKDIIKLRVEKPEDVENLILSNFNIMMNMRVEEDEKIDFEDEEECPKEEEYNLNVITNLMGIFGVEAGVSDHSLDPVLVPCLSVLCGGSIIEKHITLSRLTDGLDDPVALDPEQFALMVHTLHQTEASIRHYADFFEDKARMLSRYLFIINDEDLHVLRLYITDSRSLMVTVLKAYNYREDSSFSLL